MIPVDIQQRPNVPIDQFLCKRNEPTKNSKKTQQSFDFAYLVDSSNTIYKFKDCELDGVPTKTVIPSDEVKEYYGYVSK